MDCIPYINDLLIEIKILKELNCNDPKILRMIDDKNRKIDKIKKILSQISQDSIGYRIYLKMLNGKSVTKAINEIANENHANNTKPSEETIIWKKYYKNLKKILKSSESPVK